LDEVAGRAAAPRARAATPLAFGNPPALAARRVLSRFRDESAPIALPLWLGEDAPGEGAAARLTWGVLRALKGLSEGGGEQPLVSEAAVGNLIGTFADRLLLVAHGRPSTDLPDHEADARRWRQVCADADALPQRPRLLLLAGDAHHLDRLLRES